MPFSKRTKANYRAACALIILLFPLFLSGCFSPDKKHEAQLFSMDTIMFLTSYGGTESALEEAKLEILRIEGIFDPGRSSSEVYAINNAYGEPVQVSGDMAHVMEVSTEVFTRSGGAFDPSVYPLVIAWGFSGGGYRIPEPPEIANLLQYVDFGAVKLEQADDGAFTVQVPPGAMLGFGAVAKGYAGTMAAEKLKSLGIKAAILNLGGNVQTIGAKPDGSPWVIEIRDPNDPSGSVGRIGIYGDNAVITSGSYERYFEEEGRLYHHILDPETGFPSESGLSSITVVHPDGAVADALSTALFVLGEDGALNYRERYGGFELVMVTTTGEVIVTGGLRDSFTECDAGYKYVYLED